jgi:YbgC/YbaW family acyl-CoA thioester hydrolase
MFVTPYAVRFADVDNAGIFYYPRFFHAFHVAFEKWWDKGVGRPYHIVIGTDRVGFPAVHIDTDFRKPVTFGDPMEIHVGCKRIGNKSVVVRYEVRNRETGELHTESDITHAVVNMDSFTAIPIPDFYRQAFTSILIRESGPQGSSA